MSSTPTHSVLAGSVPLLLLCQRYLQLMCLPLLIGPHFQTAPGLSSPSPPALSDSPAVDFPAPLPFPLQEWPSQLLECLARKPPYLL